MTDTTTTQFTLPDSLVSTIDLVIASDMEPRAKFEAVVLIAHGYGLFSAVDQFSPSSHAMPEAQWGHICEALMHLKGGDGIAQVNMALDWMNIGPSGYKPVAA